MQRRFARVYEEAGAHGAVSDLIRRHSSNPIDVRDVALAGIDRVGASLDLGCGFGFMAEGLARRARPGIEIVGIDVNGANRTPFLARVRAAGCRGRFVCQALDERLRFADRSFRTVVASYSLYFFPGLVPEVARVVVPDGRFVVITHRETSLRSLLDVLGLPVAEAPQVAALHACSAETAPSVLKPWFGTVEERPYHNELVFERSDLGDLLTYVRFKLPLIIRGFPIGSDVPTPVVERAREALDGDGRIVIAKDDSVFVCTGPARP